MFTNISPSHTSFHGSIGGLIRAKAETILGLAPGGVSLMSADHPYYFQLRDEVQKLRAVPVLTWGRERWCDACLESAEFETQRGGWKVQAWVMGRIYDYFIGTHHSFAPLASLASLLTAAYLEVDVDAVAARLADYQPGRTAGRILSLAIGDQGRFTLFDYSERGSIEGYRVALADLFRLTDRSQRILLALGECRDLCDVDRESVHREIASLIKPDRVRFLLTVGEGMRITRDSVADPAILAEHADSPEGIAQTLLERICPGDVVFVQGHHRVWMSRLVRMMEERFSVNKDHLPSRMRRPLPDRLPKTTGRLVAGGDVSLARYLPARVLDDGMERVFGDVAEKLHSADAAFVNLECVLSTCGDFTSKPGEKRPYFFRAPPQLANLLLHAGISAVVTSNNHAMDFGAEALREQNDCLASLGIGQAGSGSDLNAAQRPLIMQCGGVKVALIGVDMTAPYAAATEQQPGVCHLPLNEALVQMLKPMITEIRQQAHIVILSPHWGNNWGEKPTKHQRHLARRLIDLGVDAVLGHSAHILQGVEVYKGRVIAYDMGTLVFDQVSQSRMRYSGLFELALSQHGIHELIFRPVRLSACRVRLAKASRDSILALMSQLCKEVGGEQEPIIEREVIRFPLQPDSQPRNLLIPRVEENAVFSRKRLAAPTIISAPLVQEDARPPRLAESEMVNLGGGLRLGGFRHAKRVASGYGFVLEHWLHCQIPQPCRWRAELLFIPVTGGEKDRFRYPVAGGAWHPSACHDDHWMRDRVVIRPPMHLGEGEYWLCWNLFSLREGKRRIYWTEPDGPGAMQGEWVGIGAINISTEAPAGVAGVDWGRELCAFPGTLCKSPV